MSLKGKVALITGAGGGVGGATVRRLASEDCKVVLLGRSKDKLAKVASGVKNKKNVLSVAADITRESEVLNAVEQTINAFDKIDILVNNAGVITDPMPFHKTSDRDWNEMINTNLVGTFRITRAVLPVMMKHGEGSIVNVSSVLGMRSIPKVPLSVYGVTKAGLIMFTKSIAVEYGQYGIRSNCVCPSTIRSPIIEPYLEDENARKILESSFPLRKIGDPDDVSEAIAYLCSDGAKWVTGTVLTIDGGISAKQ